MWIYKYRDVEFGQSLHVWDVSLWVSTCALCAMETLVPGSFMKPAHTADVRHLWEIEMMQRSLAHLDRKPSNVWSRSRKATWKKCPTAPVLRLFFSGSSQVHMWPSQSLAKKWNHGSTSDQRNIQERLQHLDWLTSSPLISSWPILKRRWWITRASSPCILSSSHRGRKEGRKPGRGRTRKGGERSPLEERGKKKQGEEEKLQPSEFYEWKLE